MMSDNRTRVWFALFVLAVFCAGAATGAIIVRRIGPPVADPGGWQPRGPDGRTRPLGPGRAGAPAARLVDRLDRDLQLTDDQKAAIQTIFEARRAPLERVQREMRERMEQEQRELQAEIRKVLTAEQQPKFDKWLEQDRGRGRGRGRGGPFSPPGVPPER
jgi:uncharacterized membrane protein